ncbi:MAG TPA: glycosyltransferase 87 family protein, partial [Candidatus Binataceae bacterium]|nr:glycosyltransferase 87 family protein [Candidatus Binataceae bacterium]
MRSAVAMAVFAGLSVLTWQQLRPRARELDFSMYYVEALVMRHGGNPYRDDLRPAAAALGLRLAPFAHGDETPAFILVFEPLTLLKPERAYAVWFVLNTLLLGAAWYLLAGAQPRALTLGVAALTFTPLWDQYYFAQSQIVVLVALAAAMLLLERG